MKNRLKLLKSVIVATLAILTASAVSAQEPFDFDTKYATELLKPGTVAPDFKLKTVKGTDFHLSSLKGKYVVIDFWASWCPDCRKDIPNVQRMYQAFHSKGVEFVGVSFDTDKAKWAAALEKYGITYTQVSELVKFHDTEISKTYGVKWIPSMYLIDQEGKVMISTVLSYKIERKLTELFASKAPIAGTSEKVVIGGAKGKLSAIIQKPEIAAGAKVPMAILMHGFNDSKNSGLLRLIADSLQARGIASIRFDFNGHGESEGDFSEMTVPNEVEDACKVYEHVRALPYVSTIGLAGHSQGGVVASMAAGELGTDKVKGVALLAPAAVLRDDAIRGSTPGAVVKEPYSPLDPPEYVQIGDKKLGGDYLRTAISLPIYETAARYQGPACVVHGNADRIVPYTYGERYKEVWPKCELHIMDGYDHGFWQNAYRVASIVADFLDKALSQSSQQ